MKQGVQNKAAAPPLRPLAEGPMPLYHQLERDLTERITSGEFVTRDALPTEEQICTQYGVSRITVRRALDALIANGMIVRRRGVGTFVADVENDKVRSVRFTGSLDDFLAKAGALTPRILSFSTVPAPTEICEALELEQGADAVRIEIASSLGDDPVLYLEAFFPVAIGRHLDPADVTAGIPLVRIVERTLKLKVVRALQHIDPDLAEPGVASQLGLKVGSPILRIRRVYYTADGKPIEAAILRHHPKRYQYVIEFNAGPGAV
ncbi:MAG: GntR family transcriptional regulator [Sphingomonadales bacterium]